MPAEFPAFRSLGEWLVTWRIIERHVIDRNQGLYVVDVILNHRLEEVSAKVKQFQHKLFNWALTACILGLREGATGSSTACSAGTWTPHESCADIWSSSTVHPAPPHLWPHDSPSVAGPVNSVPHL